MERLNTFSRIGLATGVALTMAHEVLTSPAEAAGPCKTLASIEVRNFEDIGGKPNFYDRGVDNPKDPVVSAIVRYLTGGRLLNTSITNNSGVAETLIQAPCSNGNKIVATIEVETPDGRRVVEQMDLPNQTKKRFGAWVAQKPPVMPTPSSVRVLTNAVRLEGGDRPIRIEKSEDWRWLPTSIVLAGALVGLGLAAAEWRRRRAPNQPNQP